MVQKLKGTRDIIPGEIEIWQYIESKAKEVFESYGFSEIRTPVIEATELFQRGVGEATDVVQKEMYVFNDKANRSISLRPEGTAGVIRAYIENGMASMPSPIKLYYEMSMYRYENVQKGRQREFHQIGTELIGSASYMADIEIVSMINKFLKKLNIKNVNLEINSIGCKKCRAEYIKALKEYIRPNLDKYCSTCQSRFEKNPMRILDCKEEQCKKLNQNAPEIIDYLCDDCKEHFEKVKEGLKDLDIEYTVNSRIVRGLDYYTKTVFEFVSNDDGLTVVGGGRYDDLIEELGGAKTPAIGFGAGEERLVSVFQSENPDLIKKLRKTPKVFVAYIGDEAKRFVNKFVEELRDNNINASKDIMERGLKAQFKYADKIGAEYTITIGEDELKNKVVSIKEMATGKTQEINIDNVVEFLSK